MNLFKFFSVGVLGLLLSSPGFADTEEPKEKKKVPFVLEEKEAEEFPESTEEEEELKTEEVCPTPLCRISRATEEKETMSVEPRTISYPQATASSRSSNQMSSASSCVGDVVACFTLFEVSRFEIPKPCHNDVRIHLRFHFNTSFTSSILAMDVPLFLIPRTCMGYVLVVSHQSCSSIVVKDERPSRLVSRGLFLILSPPSTEVRDERPSRLVSRGL